MFSPYQYGTLQNYIQTPNFGQITQTLNKALGGQDALYQVGGPRSGQFSLKLQF
jgi:hypothetical protein